MKTFLPARWSIVAMLVVGLLSILGVISQIANHPDLQSWTWREFVMLGVGILVYFTFSCVGFYYFIARLKKRGICFDSEGVYTDFSHNKIYWYEIESIHCMKYPAIGKTTVISTSAKYERKIEQRLGKLKTTFSKNSYDILWITVQKPKLMHEELLHAFEKYNNRYVEKTYPVEVLNHE